jgi:hypothetical protein
MALQSLRKKEQVDLSKLRKIITYFYQIIEKFNITLGDDSIYKEFGITKYDGLETLLRKYYEKANGDGVIKVTYNQRHNTGRYFADGSLSLISMKRQIRQTICHTFYDDIDMVNAHPVILLYLCRKNKIKAAHLEQYILNRDQILKDTGLSRDAAKNLYLMIMNSSDTDIKAINKHMTGFKKEMKNIHNSFCKLNKYDSRHHIKRRKLSGKKDNMKASYVNTLMCDIENQILMCILDFYGNPDECVLCFDGIMLKKGKRKSIKSCMKYIKKKVGIDMTLKLKDMTDMLDLSEYADIDTIPTDNRVYTLKKNLPVFNKVPDFTFNRQYANKIKTSSYFTKHKGNIVLKSDTGTGKTTAFIQLVKDTKCKFISLISLISVGDTQYKSMLENDVECSHYKLCHGQFIQGENILITLDSIRQIRTLDFSDYVLYLDEFSSLVDYIHSSTTMDDKRILCNRIFIKLIQQCKTVICTDADIGNICLKFLDSLNIKYQYHKNEFNNFQDVEAVELSSRSMLLDRVKTLDKFMICTDSKTEADSLLRDLDDPEVINITSEYKKKIDISNIKKLIISPKVLYGADSVMGREVFLLYKELTITSLQMVQQLARERNIIKLWYYFPNKVVTAPKFKNVEEVRSMIELNDSLCEFEECASEEDAKRFKNTYADILYERDCFETNKFLHLKDIIRSRGFKDTDLFIEHKKDNMTTRKEIIKDKLDNMDVDDYKTKIMDDGTVVMGKRSIINEDYLHIPDDSLEEYKVYLVDDILLSKHFNLCQFFFKKDESKKLKESYEFRARKITSSKGKMLTLRKMCETYDIDLSPNNDITISNNNDVEINSKMVKLYSASFRYQSKKKLDFSDDKTILKMIVSSFKSLFGNDIIKNRRVGKSKTRVYQINNAYYSKNQTLYQYRQQNDKNIENIQDDTGHKLNKKLFV